MSNNIRWELWSHVTCRSINIIYYLKCNTYKKKKTYIGKTVGDNMIVFNSRMNPRISDSRTGVSACKFPIYIYKGGLKNKFLNETFLKITSSWNWKAAINWGTIKITFIINVMTLLIALRI